MSDIYDDASIEFDGGPPAWGERLTAPSAGSDYAAARGLVVHPSGRYVAMAHDTSPYLEVWAFDPDTLVWGSQSDDPSPLPSSPSINGVAWHPDGTHLAVVGLNTTGANIFVYAFDPSSGDVGAQSDTVTTNTAIADAAFSPCGEFLALADDGGGKIFDFDPSTGEVGTERESEAISGEPTHAVAWSHGFEYGAGNDEAYVVWAHDKKHPSVQYVTVFAFDRSSKTLGSELVPAGQPSGAASESARSVSWRRDDLALAAAITAGGSNELFVWAFNPVTGSVGSQYSQATTGDEAEDVAWMPDGRSIVTNHPGNSQLLLWPIDYISAAIDEPIILDGAEQPSGNGHAIAADGGTGAIAFIFASHESSPYLEAWPVVMNLTFDGAHVTLSGSFVPGAIEADIVAGGRDLIATVEGDLWLQVAGGDNTVTDDIIDGITGSLSGAGTWDDEVTIAHTDVERLSPTQLKITIPAASGYSISATETITVSTPASALVRSAADITAKPLLHVVRNELAEARTDSHIILQTARHMIWQTTELGYKFFVDSDGDVAFRRTVDGGATWQPPEKVTSGADVVALDVYYERWSEEYAANQAHLLWGDATSNRFESQTVEFFHVFDPGLSTFTPMVGLGDVELVEQVTSITQGTTTVEAACSIVKRPKNRAPVAIYHGTQSGNQGIRRRFLDGTWGTLYAPPSPFAAADIHQLVMWPLAQNEPTTSGDLALIYWDTSGGIGVLGYDNSSDSWSSAVTVQEIAFDQLADRNSWASGYRIRDGHVFLTYWEWNALQQEENAALRFAEISGSASAPTVTQRAPVVDSEIYGALCALSIDQTTTHVYVAYGRSTENPRGYDKLDVFSKVYQSGAQGMIDEWGAESEFSDQDSALDASLLLADPGSSNQGSFLPTWIDDSSLLMSDATAAHDINTGVAIHQALSTPSGRAKVDNVDKACNAGHLVLDWVSASNPGPWHSADFNDPRGGDTDAHADIHFRASAIGGTVTGWVVESPDGEVSRRTGDRACFVEEWADPQGPVPLGGEIVTVSVRRDGREVGTIIYRHAEPEAESAYPTGGISVGDVVGRVTNQAPTTTGCYSSGTHLHVDWKANEGPTDFIATNDVRCPGSPSEQFEATEVVAAIVPVLPANHPPFPTVS